MNYYQFHIGDYTAHTRHLSLMEDLAYRRMLDLYYLTEGPLTGDVERIARLIGMRDYIQEVSYVLSEFFMKSDMESDAVHRNSRCDREIERYKAKAESAKNANKSRWKGKKSEPDMKSDMETNLKSDMESDAVHILTNNQEPIYTDTKVSDAEPSLKSIIFSHGVKLLQDHGSTESSARSFLGKHVKSDESKLAEVIGYLMANPKVEPRAYIEGAMKPPKRELVL